MRGTTIALGGGVTIDDSSPGELVVISRRLPLPWHENTSILPGTAVPWGDILWEAHAVERSVEGERWLLVPWTESELVRHSERIDEERIAELEAEIAENLRSRRIRDLALPVLPVIGLLPRQFQMRLEWDYNIPAGLATVTSAVVEVAFGLLLWFVLRTGAWFPPPALRWIILLSPAMVLEGLVRLWFGLTIDEPIGSFAAAPLALVLRGRKIPSPVGEGRRPQVHRLDVETGALELITDEPRGDWAVGGVLRFRGRLYRLIEKSSWQGRSLHLFEIAGGEPAVTLSLAPPPLRDRSRERGRGFIADTARCMLAAFAPRDVQELLVADMNLPVRLLTFASASLEVVGGAVNLAGSTLADPMTLFDIGILFEGMWRLVWAVVSRAPVGSVLGLPFRGVYSIWVEELSGSSADVSGLPQKGQNRKPVSGGN